MGPPTCQPMMLVPWHMEHIRIRLSALFLQEKIYICVINNTARWNGKQRVLQYLLEVVTKDGPMDTSDAG